LLITLYTPHAIMSTVFHNVLNIKRTQSKKVTMF